MLTASEAKLLAYRKRDYFATVERKISEAAESGDMMCTINAGEIPNGTNGKIYEIARFLYELGYQTAVDIENGNGLTLYVYWNVISSDPLFPYNIMGHSDSEED